MSNLRVAMVPCWRSLETVLVVFIFCVHAEKTRLDDYISHYEGLNYNTNDLHNNHQRARRSISQPHVPLQFQAHGRSFQLRLRRDTSTFSSDFKLELSDGSLVDHDISHIYEGELWGELNTRVHGAIINGVFRGYIDTPREKYYVEPASRFFKTPQGFHSVIYTDSDTDHDPYRHKRSVDLGTCGNDYSRDWMASVQNSFTGNVIRDPERTVVKRETPWNMYSEEANEESEETYNDQSRQKRATIPQRNTCTMYLQTDQELWEYFMEESDDDQAVAKEEITAFLASHVAGIKDIYSKTHFSTFDKNIVYTGVSFTVQRIKINTTDDCIGQVANSNLYCSKNIDVSNFLNINSLVNHNAFCLAYVFTYRDFTGGTLGLAWVGSHSRSRGGICEQYAEYTEAGTKVWKSLNTGIVTIVNYASRVPPKVSTLTFAHEVGHNFGSPHDQGGSCTPYLSNQDSAGNYIMFASATSGDRINNNQFSSCAKDNVTLVLDAVFGAKSDKINCFVESEAAFCGNYIVEVGEQCDCGYHEDCQDACCYGRDSAEGAQCTRKSTAVCSPSEGPCCTTQCTFRQPQENHVCSHSSECGMESECDGTASKCPTPEPKQNLTSCNKNTQICLNGECKGSVCEKIGWKQCFLTSAQVDPSLTTSERATHLCYVACQNPGNSSDCISTFDQGKLALPQNQALKDLILDTNDGEGINLPPGAACDNFVGYCDVFSKCRGVDADGPLARLKNLLFNPQTFDTIRDWIITHWWAVLLMGVGLVVFMGLFIKICAVHTPSSNPKKKAARKISLRPQPRSRGPPPAYSSSQGYSGGPARGHGNKNIDNKNRGGRPRQQDQGQRGRREQYEMKPGGR